MAKDYFQDIVPPAGGQTGAGSKPRILRPSTRTKTPPNMPPQTQEEDVAQFTDQDDEDTVDDVPSTHEEVEQTRGIRNIGINPSRSTRSRIDSLDMRRVPSLRRNRMSRLLLWGIAGISIIVLGGLGLFVFRDTTVTITPRSHTLVFDQAAQFIAYPGATAATGSLSYTVAQTDFSGSQDVAGQGTTHVETKAAGSITVYNNFSVSSEHLIKNTRFQSPDGLIFRTPADVVIPGRVGPKPGQVTVTVTADQSGTQYNIASPVKFIVPGLKTNSAMYSGIYAQSSAPISGGSSGTQTGVADDIRAGAVASIRAKLLAQAQSYVHVLNSATTTTFASLAQITYQDSADQDQANGKVAINETVHVMAPLFPADTFASVVGITTSAINEDVPVYLVPGSGYDAQLVSTSSVALGTDPINFFLVGTAVLVWQIDTRALATTLAGKDQGAFQTVITGFPGVDTAHARIEPFWKTSFPTDASKIKVVLLPPPGLPTAQKGTSSAQ